MMVKWADYLDRLRAGAQVIPIFWSGGKEGMLSLGTYPEVPLIDSLVGQVVSRGHTG